MITTAINLQWNASLGKEIVKAKKAIALKQGRIVAKTAKRLMRSGGKAASKPGQIPKRKSGNYRRSIKYVRSKRGALTFVGPSWPKGAHANMLKYGTRRMAPRLVPAEEALRIEAPRLAAMYSGTL